MEVLITINVLAFVYVFVIMKVGYNRRDKMTNGAYHHLISHTLILVFLIIGIDLYIIEGYIYPLIFTLLHLVQHVTKENIRLLKTNRWTPSIHDETSSSLN